MECFFTIFCKEKMGAYRQQSIIEKQMIFLSLCDNPFVQVRKQKTVNRGSTYARTSLSHDTANQLGHCQQAKTHFH